MISLKCSNQPISPPPTPPSRAQAAMLRSRHRISNRAPPPLPPSTDRRVTQSQNACNARVPGRGQIAADDVRLAQQGPQIVGTSRSSASGAATLSSWTTSDTPGWQVATLQADTGIQRPGRRGAAALGEADARTLAMGVTGTPDDILAAWPSSARQAPTPSTSTCTTSRTPTTSGSLAAKSSRRSPRFSSERAGPRPPAGSARAGMKVTRHVSPANVPAGS